MHELKENQDLAIGAVYHIRNHQIITQRNVQDQHGFLDPRGKL